jgi:predicted GNAT family N-acyltransferase
MTGSYSVEPLQDKHDRESFISGVPELDRYLRFQAGQDARRKVAAPFVLVGNQEAVIGYYTLSSYNIRLLNLPTETAKKLPKNPFLPATLLGRLAVSRENQGKRLGQFLLMDALCRSLKDTSEVGSIGVVVDAYDANAKKFYMHHDFVGVPGQGGKLFLAMSTIKKLFPELK